MNIRAWALTFKLLYEVGATCSQHKKPCCMKAAWKDFFAQANTRPQEADGSPLQGSLFFGCCQASSEPKIRKPVLNLEGQFGQDVLESHETLL